MYLHVFFTIDIDVDGITRSCTLWLKIRYTNELRVGGPTVVQWIYDLLLKHYYVTLNIKEFLLKLRDRDSWRNLDNVAHAC